MSRVSVRACGYDCSLYARNADMRAWRGKIDSEGSVLAQEAQLRYVSVLRARRPASGAYSCTTGHDDSGQKLVLVRSQHRSIQSDFDL